MADSAKKLTVKFNLVLAVLMLVLSIAAAYLTYADRQETAHKVALDEARDLAQVLMTTFGHMSEIVTDEPEENYQLVPQVVATQVARKISAKERFKIRQVSLSFRNPNNAPDAYEAEQLRRFAAGSGSENYEVLAADGKEVFRYMQSLTADESCLKCHGAYQAAPTFIQQRFAEDHPSYNYQPGEVLGAISVSRPMGDLYGEVASGLKLDMLYRAAIILLVLLVTWLTVRQLILGPLELVATTINRITRTGNLKERIPAHGANDEVGRLIADFNEMMAELDRTTLQREESEDRYRSLIEATQLAIVTFLENGKIVISNQAAEQLLGRSRNDLLGETFYPYLENGDWVAEKVKALAQGGRLSAESETHGCRLKSAAGRMVAVELTLVLASKVENAPMFTAIIRVGEDV